MGQQESIPEVDYDNEPHFRNVGGKRIACQYWNPTSSTGSPRALVFLAHGAREHCHWYDVVAEPLTELNVVVFAHDHVGHGKSEGDRVHVDHVSEYTQDVIQHVSMMKDKYRDIPVFIVGFSMGGLIALHTAMEKPDLFAGLVLVAPAINPGTGINSPLKESLLRLAGYAIPQFQFGMFLPDRTMGVSRDLAIVKRLGEHPLMWQGKSKTKWLICMLDAMKEIQLNMENFKFPFFVLHGDQDMIIDVSGSKLLYEKASSEDKTLKIYPGGYHQLQTEPDGMKEEVIADILEWINHRLPPLPPPPPAAGAAGDAAQ